MGQNRATNRVSDIERTQRERLVAGMLAAVNADGYDAATIRNVIVRAGVSRPTFYEHFTDKDDCFLALYREISGKLLDDVGRAVDSAPPERALHAIVRELFVRAETEPAQTQFLASDALAGGHLALDERERTISQISKIVTASDAVSSPQSRAPDLPAQVVIGATHSLISQRMRRAEPNLTQLADELARWLDHYEGPLGAHRWPSLAPEPRPESFAQRSETADHALPQVPSKESRALPGAAAQRQWRRLLVATAESAVQGGYNATTVTAIAARTQLNKYVYYKHFRDKRQAFLVLHEFAFRQSIDRGATAYFSAQRWPERVWRCLLATSQFYASNPALAQIGFVEAHALGLPAIQRVENTRHAFATLLRADSRHSNPSVSATAAEASGAAILELVHDRVRRLGAKELPRYAYHAAYLVLAPFLGVQAANRFVRQKIKDAERRTGP